jgi:diketogulonate reductase-like aldo/keto reductase
MTGHSLTLTGGVQMPVVGLGTWQSHGDECYRAVLAALELGYRHLDTATMYRNEEQVGRAIRDSGIPREQVFVTTKLPPERAGRERATLAESLDKLGLDYLDLWLIHWPPRGDPGTATWAEFLKIRGDGLARAVGVSNYSPAQLDVLTAATGEAPAVNQIPWSPWEYDAGLLAEHASRGVVVEGYSPFKRSRLRDKVLAEVAAAHRVTPAHVILRWHIQHDVVVIPKSVRPERLAANLNVFRFTLTPQEMAAIDALGA